MKNSPRQIVARSSKGFSLVEVVLAVAIMALGVVTLLGLLPHGLEISRKTANEIAEIRIIQQIVGEMQSASWASLATMAADDQRRYFDDQGLELITNTEIEEELSFVVSVSMPALDVYLPTTAGVTPSPINQNLRRVEIKVAPFPVRDFNFNDPQGGAKFKTFTQLIAKMR